MHYSSSDNYLWNTIDSLGKGATGGVFKGRHMKTGNSVAIKVFNTETNSFWRELDILKNTPMHDNIVKFISMETEHSSKRRVIIMELCTGGSLYNIIDHPENGFGLCEDELISVIRDVVSGLNHLHKQKIIHRDIKPGNIMRCIVEDGSHVYKLVDFGAARQLDPTDTFTSLYGTEEYLHPDMYERAVLRKNKGKTFTRNVDLWSIGATFYHVITGRLPFRPFLGRLDQQTMFRMTGEKKSGVISASQHEQNGKIFWETSLPEYISALAHFRLLLSSILVGILESNPDNCMTFPDFIDQIRLITSLKSICIFCLFNSSFLKIYIDTKPKVSNWFAQLKERVATFTDIPPVDQMYFLDHERFTFSPEKDIPLTTLAQPFYLVNSTNVITAAQFISPPDFILSDESIALDRDYQNTKSALGIIHYFLKNCKCIIAYTLLIDNIASTLYSTLFSDLSTIQAVLNTSKQVLNKFKIFEKICTHIHNSRIQQSTLAQGLSTLSEFIHSVQFEFNERSHKIIDAIDEFESRFDCFEKLSLAPFYATSPLENYSIYEKQFGIYLKSMNEAQTCFIRDYKHNNLVHPLERANHNFYVKQAYQTFSQSIVLYEKVMSTHIDYHKNFILWYNGEIDLNLRQIDQLNFNVKEIEDQCVCLNVDVDKYIDEVFSKSMDCISCTSKDIIVNENFHNQDDTTNILWKRFIFEAGPSILSLDRLASLLSEFPS